MSWNCVSKNSLLDGDDQCWPPREDPWYAEEKQDGDDTTQQGISLGKLC